MYPGPDYAGEHTGGGRRSGVPTQWTNRQRRHQSMLPDDPPMEMDDEPREPAYVRRHGLMAWWLDLTAPPVPNRTLPIAERERLRKAELTSYSILAIFCFLIALVSNSLASPATAGAVGLMAVGLFIAGVLNRLGRTRTAAYLIPSLMMLVIALAIVGNRAGLDLVLIRAYDLFVLPIFLTSLIGDRKAPWIFALIAIAFITGDFAIQHHALTYSQGATGFDTIQYEINIVGWWGAINRSVALAIFAAFFGWLGARSVENAIARADTAEELAALEHTVAEQRRRLEVGVQQILETHVRVANGDFGARAPMNHDSLLWQIASSLNNLLGRLQKAGYAEHQYRRTEDEMRRVAAAIDDARAGRRPIWPAPAGTPADLIIERLSGRGRRPAAPMPTSPPPYASPVSPRGPMPSMARMPAIGHLPQQPIPPMPGLGRGTGGSDPAGGRGAGMPGTQSPVPPPPFPMPAPSFRPPSLRSQNDNGMPPRTVSSVPESGPLGPLTGSLGTALNADADWPPANPGAMPDQSQSAQHEPGPASHWFEPSDEPSDEPSEEQSEEQDQ